jgi:hypothetical protein
MSHQPAAATSARQSVPVQNNNVRMADEYKEEQLVGNPMDY